MRSRRHVCVSAFPRERQHLEAHAVHDHLSAAEQLAKYTCYAHGVSSPSRCLSNPENRRAPARTSSPQKQLSNVCLPSSRSSERGVIASRHGEIRWKPSVSSRRQATNHPQLLQESQKVTPAPRLVATQVLARLVKNNLPLRVASIGRMSSGTAVNEIMKRIIEAGWFSVRQFVCRPEVRRLAQGAKTITTRYQASGRSARENNELRPDSLEDIRREPCWLP